MEELRATAIILGSIALALLVVVGGAVACNRADNATWQKFAEHGYSQKCGTPVGTTTCNMTWVK